MAAGTSTTNRVSSQLTTTKKVTIQYINPHVGGNARKPNVKTDDVVKRGAFMSPHRTLQPPQPPAAGGGPATGSTLSAKSYAHYESARARDVAVGATKVALRAMPPGALSHQAAGKKPLTPSQLMPPPPPRPQRTFTPLKLQMGGAVGSGSGSGAAAVSGQHTPNAVAAHPKTPQAAPATPDVSFSSSSTNSSLNSSVLSPAELANGAEALTPVPFAGFGTPQKAQRQEHAGVDAVPLSFDSPTPKSAGAFTTPPSKASQRAAVAFESPTPTGAAAAAFETPPQAKAGGSGAATAAAVGFETPPQAKAGGFGAAAASVVFTPKASAAPRSQFDSPESTAFPRPQFDSPQAGSAPPAAKFSGVMPPTPAAVKYAPKVATQPVAKMTDLVQKNRFPKANKVHSFIPRHPDGKLFELILLGNGEYKDAYILAPNQPEFLKGFKNEDLVIKVYTKEKGEGKSLRNETALVMYTKFQMHQFWALRDKATCAAIYNDPLKEGYFVCQRINSQVNLVQILQACNKVKSAQELLHLSSDLLKILMAFRIFINAAIAANTPLDFGNVNNPNFLLDQRTGHLTLIDYMEDCADYSPEVRAAILGEELDKSDPTGPLVKIKAGIMAISKIKENSHNKFVYQFLVAEIKPANALAYDILVKNAPFAKA